MGKLPSAKPPPASATPPTLLSKAQLRALESSDPLLQAERALEDSPVVSALAKERPPETAPGLLVDVKKEIGVLVDEVRAAASGRALTGARRLFFPSWAYRLPGVGGSHEKDHGKSDAKEEEAHEKGGTKEEGELGRVRWWRRSRDSGHASGGAGKEERSGEDAGGGGGGPEATGGAAVEA